LKTSSSNQKNDKRLYIFGRNWLVFGKYREVKTCLQSFKINVCSCFHSLWWCVHN
jgi:hypothetical protein